MNCMKCGREIGDGQVFCESCLAEMARYPVKPGTVVQLPYHAPQPVRRAASRRKLPTPAEQAARLRKTIRWMGAALAAALLLLALTAGALIRSLRLQDSQSRDVVGRNYSTAGQADGT